MKYLAALFTAAALSATALPAAVTAVTSAAPGAVMAAPAGCPNMYYKGCNGPDMYYK